MQAIGSGDSNTLRHYGNFGSPMVPHKRLEWLVLEAQQGVGKESWPYMEILPGHDVLAVARTWGMSSFVEVGKWSGSSKSCFPQWKVLVSWVFVVGIGIEGIRGGSEQHSVELRLTCFSLASVAWVCSDAGARLRCLEFFLRTFYLKLPSGHR